MAHRQSIIARARLFYHRQPRIAPFSHFHSNANDCEDRPTNTTSKNLESVHHLHSRFYGTVNCASNLQRCRSLFHDRKSAIPSAWGSVCVRNMSSSSLGEGAADKIEILNDMADVFASTTVEVASHTGPVVNEVAVAATGSFFPVAALQYLVDYVHIFTGFNWWASIAVTTLLIRGIQIPIMIHQIKATTKFTLLRPKLEEINQEMQDKGMSPAAVAEGQARSKKLFKEYGVTPFTPMKGLLIQGPLFCCFFFALRNMVDKVPSFKEGGAFWFTDLTIADSMYIFPVLTALTFWITVELNTQEGLEGNPAGKTIKNFSRGFAILTVPFTASFPQALFCYWITSNLFSLSYGMVIKNPKIKKFLGIPDIPVAPPSSKNQKPFSFFEALKKYAAAQQKQSLSSTSLAPVELASKTKNQRIPSSNVLNQRISSLEKEVKGRKRGKKRL